MYIDMKVLGGLPVEIYVEGDEWYVTRIAGRRVKKFSHVKWLHNKIEASRIEYQRVLDAISEAE